MVLPSKLTKWLFIACLASIVLLSNTVAVLGGVKLEEYGEGDKQFEVFDIGDKMVVYFHQRMLGDAIVEKNYIVYQFDKATGILLDRRSHWRTDLPDNLPDITINYDRLRTAVEHEFQSAGLWIISPVSDVFPLDPCPQNPCWVTRSIEDGYLIITIIDAVTGEHLGNGIPPPYAAFSLTGPQYFNPCYWFWDDWSLNAASWFNSMGYSTQHIIWPTENQVKAHVQSTETALFYELAHGGSTSFASGCIGGNLSEYTYATEIETWITGYEKMPFTFIGSCDGLCSTGDNTFAYEFRKGSLENTAVVGYCGMSTDNCETCWTFSLSWQDDLFYYMSLGWSVKDAFDQANANYPACLSNSCMRFSGDQSFAIIPRIQRVPGPCLISPLDIDFGTLSVGCYRDTTFIIKNIDPDPISVDITESCDFYSIISGGGFYSLASGESVIVTVRFEPTAVGTHNCTIDTGPSSCSDVNLTGVANNGCTVYPLQLDFGAIELGDSADMDFTIYNVGCDTLFGSVSEPCFHYEIVSGGGSYTIPLDDSLVVTVRYKPMILGSSYCLINTGASCTSVSCEGLCYEPSPACLIEPDTLDFGTIEVGGFDIKTFDITNTGYGTLSGTISETCSYFAVVTGGTYSLTHDQSQTVTILFSASTEGPHECTIETGNATCADLYCMGFGGSVGPECLIDPDTLDFGTVLVGNYIDLNFSISNTGGDTLSGTVSETCDHYQIISGDGIYALAAGESVVVTVRFEPTASGNHTCSIETGSGLCADVYCTGNGMNPALCIIEPDTLDYGVVTVGDSLDLEFILTNGGGDVLTGDVSDTCSCYNVVDGGGPYGLAAGETLQVTVRFKPPADGSFECWVAMGVGCGDVYCTGVGDDLSGLGIVNRKRFFLYQNYPNPFNPTTNITFTVPEKAHTNLSIYSIEGRLVKTLVNTEFDGGLNTVTWDGRDSRGNPVSSGVYFYRLRAGSNVMTKKMILLK